jgi:hypothetical protein
MQKTTANATNTTIFNLVESNNLNRNNKSHSIKKKTREKKYWSEREEKTLFVLQMALGTKFSIIKTFLKGKEVNDIKNHFYSKLRTYLSIQISSLKSENFFENMDPDYYDIRKILSLVLSNKIPTMILNKSIIKELILKEEQKKKLKKNENLSKDKNNEEKNGESKLHRKRGRPRKDRSKNNKNLKTKKKSTKVKEKIFIFNCNCGLDKKEEKKNDENLLEKPIKKESQENKNILNSNNNNITIELGKASEILNDADEYVN